MRIRQRQASDFVREMDVARVAYASVQTKEGAGAYERVRRQMLRDAGEVGATPASQVNRGSLPPMFRGAPDEFLQHVVVRGADGK